jgi:hypothetical protein
MMTLLPLSDSGNHYLYHPAEQNYTRAMEYFLKAAALRNDDAHFSLAMLYREGLGCPKDVPRSVAHLAVAASWGHLRALNFLAHALYDADSWLAQYGREQHLHRRKQAMASVLAGTSSYHSQGGVLTGLQPSAPAGNSNATAAADALLHSSMVFDAFELIKIYLADGSVVPLPYPLGNPEGERSWFHCDCNQMRASHSDTCMRAGACEAALPLLKHIAEMSYRPKDVTSRALRHFMKGEWRTML